MASTTNIQLDDLPPSICDRQNRQDGATRLKNPMMMRIKYNAELAEPNMCFKCMGVCGCFPCLGIFAPPCSFYDMERSYLYLRENSIESNVNINNYVGDCLGCPTADFVTVSYFDRPPYAVSGCICPTVPKLEVVDTSCYFCCMRCEGDKFVSIMPCEYYCLCCHNRTNKCSSYCGLCGPVEGVPIFYSGFYPQPENTEAFVAMAHQVIPRAQRME